MKRRFTILTAALALLVCLAIPMGVWGQTTHTIGWGTASGDAGTFTNFTTVSGQVAGVLSFSSEKNDSGSNPAYNANASELRLYYASSGNGGSITIKPASGVTITGAVMTTSTTPSVKYFVDGGTTGTSVTASNSTYTISNISVSTSLKIQNANTTNTQLRIKTIALTYTTGGSVPTTYTVTYNSNVAGTAPVVDTYVEGDNVTLRAANTFTNEGYTFSEWNTQADGDGDAYEAEGTIENIQDDINLYAQWEELDPNTDVLNYDFTGINGTSYAEWTNTSTLGTVYVGQSGGQHSSIQLRTNNNNSGIVTTLSLGNATKVAVNWNSNTQDGRVLNVYGKAAAYSAVTDLYNVTSQGELLGTIVKGTSTELTITGNYAYIGLRSADGAMYLDEIRITWEISNDPVCTVTPDTHEFGNVAIGSTATQSFTVSTANLIGDLTLSMSNSVFTVAPTTIEQNASSTQVTITFAPTNAGGADASLIVNGSGFTNEEVALVSGTGVPVRTITFNAGNGTCGTQTMSGVDGATITLPTATPSTACAAAGWTFAGWSASNVTETTTAPTLLNDEYVINGDATLYAVYVLSEGEITTTNNVFTNGSYSNEVITWTLENCVVIVQEQNTGQTAPNESYINAPRWYSGNKITITPSVNVNSIIVTANTEGYATALKNSTYTNATAAVSGTTVTITPTSGTAPITIVMGAQSRLSSLILNYGSFYYIYNSNPSCLESVATPTFSPVEGTYYESQSVTISCETQDATIYYTTNGTDPTNASTQYTGAITVAETTTIKAIAYDGTDYSDVATATYTIELPLSTMDEIYAKAQEVGSTATSVGIAFGDWVVTGANSSSHTFVSDGIKGFMVYGSDHGFSAGDVLSGIVECKVQLYNGAAEITQLTSSTSGLTVTTGGTVTVADIAMADLTGINTGALVSYKNLTCEERVEGSYTNYYLSDGTTEIQAYKTLLNNYADYLEDGKTYNITGVFVLNNETKRINPRSAADIVPIFTKTIIGRTTGGYQLIASPIGQVAPANVTNMTANSFDLYRFNANAALQWENYKQVGDDHYHFNLEPGRGYLYANSETVDLVFMGQEYSGDALEVTLNAQSASGFKNWNLVGNPFAEIAHIQTAQGHTLNYYTVGVKDGQTNQYIAATNTSIQPMEGVFVIASVDGEKITFARGESETKSSQLALNINSSRNLVDRAIVRFDECRQLPKFQLNEDYTKVYIPMDGEEYAVVHGEEMGELPVNFKAEENGHYSLNLSSENVEFAYLHLIDNLTGNDVDLLQTPSYSFEAKTTDYASRFKLVYATGDNSNSDNFAFFSNGSFVINNYGIAELQVVDIMGRILSSETINGCSNVSVNAAPGVYMLRLVNGDNVKVQKVVVK